MPKFQCEDSDGIECYNHICNTYSDWNTRISFIPDKPNSMTMYYNPPLFCER